MTKQYNYGFQDYSFPPYTHDNPMPNKWSGCSNDDFMAAYQLFKSRDGTYCLEERVPPKGIILSRPHSGSPFGLPAPYPPPGAFTRPLPDSWGLPDS